MWKFGADTSTDENGIRWDRLDHFADQLDRQETLGRQNIATISGALATALAELGMTYEQAQEAGIEDHMLTTSGNIDFMAAWKHKLRSRGLRAGELLITHLELGQEQEGRSFRETAEDYLTRYRWIALVNESGSTGDEETKKLAYGGDNDGLGLEVGDATDVDVINFMTEVEGVFDTQNRLMREITADNFDEAMRATADGVYSGRKSKISKGGMRSKLSAAWEAAERGMIAHIASAASDFEDVLESRTGTLFLPH